MPWRISPGPPSPVSPDVFRTATVLFGLALAAVAAGSSAALSPFEDCQLRSLEGTSQRNAECARLTVALDQGQPGGPQLELFVARIASLSGNAANDPLVLINGGPGGSSVDLYLQLAPAFAGVLEHRDVLLLDQRGTGRSQALQCAVDMTSMEAEQSVADIRAQAEACLNALTTDPRFFTTSVAVRDLELLRTSAGYDALNLYGVSYGTRVALHYLRRYPEQVRSLTLDGVVPPDVVLGPNVAVNAQAALDQVFARCRGSRHCRGAFPDLEAEFAALARRLRSAPPRVAIAHPVTGTLDELQLQYGYLALVTRLMSYAPETTALLPLTIHQAAQGDFRAVAGQALSLLDQLSNSLSYGMHNSVVCSEDAPRFAEVDRTLDAAQLSATYLGEQQYDALKAICRVWPRGPVDPGFGEPLQSDAPVLLLSGEFDPITPPAYAERVAAGLSNSHHIVAPGQGHGVIGRGCLPRVLHRFLVDADIEEARTTANDCVGRQAALPFFVNSMGPVPAPAEAQNAP